MAHISVHWIRIESQYSFIKPQVWRMSEPWILGSWHFRNTAFWSASLGPLKTSNETRSVVFPTSLLGCFDFWALSLTDRGQPLCFLLQKSIVTRMMWSSKFCWSLDLKCFISREIFCLLSCLYIAFSRSTFVRLRLCYDWSWFCTLNFPHFYWRNFSFLSLPRLWRGPSTRTQQLLVVLHQALHADTYTGPLAFFGHQIRCGCSIACVKLGFWNPIPQEL